MALLTRQSLAPETGLGATYGAAAGGGDTVPVTDGKTLLHVKNGSGAPITVTVNAQVATFAKPGYGTLARANIAVSVPAGGERFIGPIPEKAFANASGLASITYSGVTSLTVAALALP